ncbi:MAG TPA: sigma factor-like helix-turn-helix DNA-binding protein [Acidimicrobiales bacterium]|nr:sigma factor-like helix-turn-helix DNA-binding protein [Acidimicrobiales bacterium]
MTQTTIRHPATLLEALAPRDAAAVLLAARPGVTYQDVARLLDRPPDDVLASLRRGLSALRAATAATTATG